MDIVPGPGDVIESGEFTWADAQAGARLWLIAIDRSDGLDWASSDEFLE